MPGRSRALRHFFVSCTISGWSLAERLPIRVPTTGDGLPRNEVDAIPGDLRGFLWVATANGIARYDGNEFVTFGTSDSLPSPYVSSIVEAGGTMWIGTTSGLARMKQNARGGEPLFEKSALANSGPNANINALAAASDGTLVVATMDGLYRGAGASNGRSTRT